MRVNQFSPVQCSLVQSSPVQSRVRTWPDPSHWSTHCYQSLKKCYSFAVFLWRQSPGTSMYFHMSPSLFWCPFSHTSSCLFLTHRLSLCLLLLIPSFLLTILLVEKVSHDVLLQSVQIRTNLRKNYSRYYYYDAFSESSNWKMIQNSIFHFYAY